MYRVATELHLLLYGVSFKSNLSFLYTLVELVEFVRSHRTRLTDIWGVSLMTAFTCSTLASDRADLGFPGSQCRLSSTDPDSS